MENELSEIKSYLNAKIALADKTGSALTYFLTEQEQELLASLVPKTLNLKFDGGMENAERKRALITLEEGVDLAINLVKLTCNPRFLVMTHQNILGSILSTGIKRASIGDIYLEDDVAYIAVVAEILPHILNDFTKINNVPIRLEPSSDKVKIKQDFLFKDIVVASMRADVIIAEVLNLSRNKALDCFTNGLIALNHLPLKVAHHQLKTGDMLSVRHFGRIYIKSIKRTTKNNKIVLELAFLKR